MAKKNPPPPPPRRSNFLISKPNNWVPPNPAPRSQEETHTEQAFQPEPEPPSPAAAPRSQEETHTEQAFQPTLDLQDSAPANPDLIVPSDQALAEYARQRRSLQPLKPKPSKHREHYRWPYLVRLCSGNVETAERLAKMADVETAIWKLERDRR